MAKRMMADVLWEAANKHLSAQDPYFLDDRYQFSCEAVGRAIGIVWTDWARFLRHHQATRFMRELGCKCGSSRLFDRFEEGEERQGVRYMWLLLAMHVAQDEGIEV